MTNHELTLSEEATLAALSLSLGRKLTITEAKKLDDWQRCYIATIYHFYPVDEE